MKKKLALPITKADLDYMETHLQRKGSTHADFESWWKESMQESTGRKWLQVILTMWEAGRMARK